MIRIYADFQNADESGRVRLNTVGSMEDIHNLNLPLQAGDKVLLYNEELSVVGTVDFNDTYQFWVATIDWNNVKAGLD